MPGDDDARPELRHPRRADVATYRVRVDLDHADPPIWRRLDLRSDLRLDHVHQVLQVAFDWTDSHLHRFSLGGHAFDRTSQLFLCPYDVEEGEDDGVPAADVRLDETLQEPGDAMAYLYDYGDSWELTLRLEEVLLAATDGPPAVVSGGDRAAPPEDSGGGTDAESIAQAVDDPAHVDLGEVNQALRAPYLLLRQYAAAPRLVDAVGRLRGTSIGEDLGQRLLTVFTESSDPDPHEIAAALAAHRWFLDRAKGGGIELTSAGYLKPVDVEAASRVVPAMGDWYGQKNREVHALPLLDFRGSLRAMGLLRKSKGTLLLTRAGAAARRDPEGLWVHLAERLATPGVKEFDTIATLLVLAYAATSPGAVFPSKQVARALSELGWHYDDGRSLEGHELYRLDVFITLTNVADGPAERTPHGWISPAAAALARAALRLAR